MLGVIAGVLLGIGVVALAGVSTSASSCLLVVGLAIGLFLRTGPELNTQIAISALLLVVVTEDADTYAVERIWETAVGSVVSLVVAAFVLPPDPLRRERSAGWPRRRGRSRPISPTAQGTLTRGDPSRARPARTRGRARARRRARRRGSAASAARAALEPAAARLIAPQLEVVERRQRLALRLAIQMRRLARDLASFAHRDDLRDEWDEARRGACRRSSRPSPPASSKALAGEGCSHEVAEARELHRGVPAARTRRPVAAILRRPLVLLLDELAGPPA